VAVAPLGTVSDPHATENLGSPTKPDGIPVVVRVPSGPVVVVDHSVAQRRRPRSAPARRWPHPATRAAEAVRPCRSHDGA